MDRQYWATLQGAELVGALEDKVTRYFDDLEEKGIMRLLERAYLAYYGGDLESDEWGQFWRSNKVASIGRNGKISQYKANHARNVANHMLNLVTAQKPALQCRAINSDYRSQAQTILGEGIIDYYMREEKVGALLRQAVEMSLVQFEAWIHCPWNPDAGEKYEAIDGRSIQEGDIDFKCYPMVDVVRDIHVERESEHNWLTVRTKASKWDLAAIYPDQADAIMEKGDREYAEFRGLNRYSQQNDEDNVDVWVFYHKRTPAMPEGRMVQFVDDILLLDLPLIYRQIPLVRMAGAEVLGTPYGYSIFAEILGPQQGLDRLNTTIMSNQSTFGMQSIMVTGNAKISVSALGEGYKLFRVQDPEGIKPLQLTQTPAEVFNFAQQIKVDIEQLMGLNSTVRGNPPNQSSGAQAALLVSQAIQFASSIESAYIGASEDVGTTIIHHMHDFGQTKRMVTIIGESNRAFQESYQPKSDLDKISRCVADIANPFSKTASGRLQIAETLMQHGKVDAMQYINVLKTGNLDPATEDDTAEILNVKAENEDLRKGSEVKALVSDDHAYHIKKHRAIISNPIDRRNDELVAATLEHIQEHLDLWRGADPGLLMVTGQQPPPPPAGMMGPEEGEPVSEQMQLPNLENQPIPQGPFGEQDMPNMPSMPSMPQGAPEESAQSYEKMLGAI